MKEKIFNTIKIYLENLFCLFNKSNMMVAKNKYFINHYLSIFGILAIMRLQHF